jgi:hypothetical protein
VSRVVSGGPSARRITSQILGADLWLKRDDIIERKWEPEFSGSGSMTVTPTSVDASLYVAIPLLSLCYINLIATLTTGGVASHSVQFSLPFPAKFTKACFSAVVVDGSFDTARAQTSQAEGSFVTVNRGSSTNWTLGTDRVISVSGIYVTA